MNALNDFPGVGAAAEFDEPAELHRVHSDRQPAYRYRCDAQEAVNMIAAGREQTEIARKHSSSIVSRDARGVAAAKPREV